MAFFQISVDGAKTERGKGSPQRSQLPKTSKREKNGLRGEPSIPRLLRITAARPPSRSRSAKGELVNI